MMIETKVFPMLSGKPPRVPDGSWHLTESGNPLSRRQREGSVICLNQLVFGVRALRRRMQDGDKRV